MTPLGIFKELPLLSSQEARTSKSWWNWTQILNCFFKRSCLYNDKGFMLFYHISVAGRLLCLINSAHIPSSSHPCTATSVQTFEQAWASMRQELRLSWRAMCGLLLIARQPRPAADPSAFTTVGAFEGERTFQQTVQSPVNVKPCFCK